MARGDRVRSDPKGDARTPMAWQHRDQNYMNNHQQQSDSRGDTFDSSRYSRSSKDYDPFYKITFWVSFDYFLRVAGSFLKIGLWPKPTSHTKVDRSLSLAQSF